MHVSKSKVILELAFHELKQKGLLYEGSFYYCELKKNTLKNFLKKEWKWEKREVVLVVKHWIKENFIKLNGCDCIEFLFTEVVNRPMRIGYIDE